MQIRLGVSRLPVEIKAERTLEDRWREVERLKSRNTLVEVPCPVISPPIIQESLEMIHILLHLCLSSSYSWVSFDRTFFLLTSVGHCLSHQSSLPLGHSIFCDDPPTAAHAICTLHLALRWQSSRKICTTLHVRHRKTHKWSYSIESVRITVMHRQKHVIRKCSSTSTDTLWTSKVLLGWSHQQQSKSLIIGIKVKSQNCPQCCLLAHPEC